MRKAYLPILLLLDWVIELMNFVAAVRLSWTNWGLTAPLAIPTQQMQENKLNKLR